MRNRVLEVRVGVGEGEGCLTLNLGLGAFGARCPGVGEHANKGILLG